VTSTARPCVSGRDVVFRCRNKKHIVHGRLSKEIHVKTQVNTSRVCVCLCVCLCYMRLRITYHLHGIANNKRYLQFYNEGIQSEYEVLP
jgi:hypothetical protein